ncbi:GNAT family N-acetyltransferase [Pseudenhygromyxa sp. WMMC2535]|uniref:GNAT family N-acetyltransferase n=1 Tax=Pseudenhygromyxa sp. WMMC2535 TaxID=2712867 RepID=UPI001556567A|nr:GNAT family N-acetyltransferase [Pseudenhygromyxa sp. WMMC2535]NVB42658.1 GNAT family N-acetyltransferase [Pseudenhygromyxa sp. WMMC2535]
MTIAARLKIRPAQPEDAEAVNRLLERSYGQLLAGFYEPRLLERALPAMVRANPSLLACGTWYLAEDAADGRLLGCGGFTSEAPGGGSSSGRHGHVRHVASDPDALRRGVARAVLERSLAEARARGLSTLEAASTLAAERFHAAMGFVAQRRFDVEIPWRGAPGGEPEILRFPAVLMTRAL